MKKLWFIPTVGVVLGLGMKLENIRINRKLDAASELMANALSSVWTKAVTNEWNEEQVQEALVEELKFVKQVL